MSQQASGKVGKKACTDLEEGIDTGPSRSKSFHLALGPVLLILGCFICTSADAEESSLPLSVLRVLARVTSSFHRWSGGLLSGWGPSGACGRGQFGAERLHLVVFSRGNVPATLHTPPAPYHGFHPQTQHVTRAVNNSTSFETLPPMFGSLLGKQRCLHSDISWCEVLTGTRCHQVYLCAYLSVVFKQQSWKSMCYHLLGK